MTWTLFPDEYAGDGDRTDYVELRKHVATIGQKAGEGIGSYTWYPPHAARAAAAGLVCGAYFWPLIRENAALQARQFIGNAPNADWYASDLEEGQPGTHAYNGDASKAEVLAAMHTFFDTFHGLRPTKPLLLYGSALMAGKGIHFDELVGDRDWIWAWLPRYSGGGDIRSWTLPQVLVYAEPQRYGVPPSRVGAVQYTNGSDGPGPRTVAGLNRNEDMSVLLVPLEQLTGKEDDMPSPKDWTADDWKAFTAHQTKPDPDEERVREFVLGQLDRRARKPMPAQVGPRKNGWLHEDDLMDIKTRVDAGGHGGGFPDHLDITLDGPLKLRGVATPPG